MESGNSSSDEPEILYADADSGMDVNSSTSGLKFIGEVSISPDELNTAEGIIISVPEMTDSDKEEDKTADPDFDRSQAESESESHGLSRSASEAESRESADSFRPKKRKLYTNRRKSAPLGGRKKDPIWDKFEAEPCGAKSRPKYRCKICRQGKLSGEAHRLKQHYQNCSKRLMIETQLPSPESTASTSSTQHSVEPSQRATSPRMSFSSSVKTNSSHVTVKKQSKLSCLSKTSRDQHQQLDRALAKFIYSSNSPFNTVNNNEFKQFVKEMRPSYTPPSAKVIGGSLLDGAFDEIKNEIVSELTGKMVVIQQDGWSTCQNQPVIAHSVATGNKNFFIHAENTGTEKKTAEFCQQLLENQIRKVQAEYHCTVIGCVTDNCSTMQKMRRDMIQSFPELYLYGCNSHLLNLIGQEITPKETILDVVKVQKYFRNHHYESGSLVQLKGSRPVLPCDTRWNSQIDTLESFMKNHTKYLEVSRDQQSKMPSEIRSTIEDIGFFKRVESAVKKIKPVQTALDKLQGDQSTLADAVGCWIGLKKNLKEFGNEKGFNDRMQLAMVPFAVAAYMLHPIYRGRDLTGDLFESGNEWLASKNPLFFIAAANLKLNDSNFYPSSFLEATVSTNMNPANWWAAVSGFQRLPIGLSELAQALMKLPASSAGIERCFSSLGNIMSTKRNRLEVEKGYKLCYIYQYYRNKNKDEVYIGDSDLD